MDFNVNIEEEVRVEFPDNAITYGLGPCIGIAILNKKLNKKKCVGYLGHYVGEEPISSSLIDLALKESENSNDLEIALAGNIPLERDQLETEREYKEGIEKSKRIEKNVLKMLKDKGIKNIKNKLKNKPSTDYSYTLYVSTQKNKIIVEKEKF